MKKLWKYLLLGVFFILGWLVFYSELIKYPVGRAEKIAAIKVEPNYVPIDYQENYATIRSCGKRCVHVNVIYDGSKGKLVVTATDYVSWYDDPKWDKKNKISGTEFYYQSKDDRKLLYWKDEKEELELGLEYSGEKLLPKEELIKIAKSINDDGKKLNN